MVNNGFERLINRAVKTLLFWSPLRSYVLYKYRYGYSPAQLSFLINTINDVAHLDGDFCEIGCYRGYTTVFLNRHIDEVCPMKKYWAIDTFKGFTAEGIRHEITVREKNSVQEKRSFKNFTVNSRKWCASSLKLNGIRRVELVKMPIADFEFPPETCLSFALIDVDLYSPTQAALCKVWERLVPGGHIIVDDCQMRHVYDGAREAYIQFCAEIKAEPEFSEGKLGILRKKGSRDPESVP